MVDITLLVGLVWAIAWTWSLAPSTTKKVLTVLAIVPFIYIGFLAQSLFEGLAGSVVGLAGQVSCIIVVVAMGRRFRDQAMQAAGW